MIADASLSIVPWLIWMFVNFLLCKDAGLAVSGVSPCPPQAPTHVSDASVINHIGTCNKHIPDGVSLNGERLIVVHIVIVDYLHSLVGGSLITIRPEGTKSNR